MDNLVEITIDGRTVQVPAGITILQACADIGIEIPRFCYHERLSVSGNCRMCLVQVANSPKPVASCAMIVSKGMEIFTNSEVVKKAREGVVEFLLINHPLDCPICDQGGECDLQDQTVAFGSDRGRFYDSKRAVVDKDCGPIVKTVMTRCIQCTRCVRFITEISGIEQFGLSGRGNRMEIGTYVQQNLTSELSGNIVDLCPVGALTSKPYQFKGRPWELKNVESIDLSDGVGSNIRIDTRGNQLLRILPRMNSAINEEWISDKTRHAVVDGCRTQRIDSPMMKINGNLDKISWQQLLQQLTEKLANIDGQEIAFYVDTASTDVETMLMVKDLAHFIGCPNLFTYGNGHGSIDQSMDPSLRQNYSCNFEQLEKADVCLLLAVNPRKEAAMLNVRLRRRVLKGELLVASIGLSENLTYPCSHLGGTISVLLSILEGRHPFCKVLAQAKNPVILVSAEALSKTTSYGKIYGALRNRFKQAVQILHRTSNGVGALDIGFSSGVHANDPYNYNYKLCYVFGGLVNSNRDLVEVLSKAQHVVYQGSHGQNINNLSFIIPGLDCATEKQGLYINTEGRVQETKVAINSSKGKDDWKIVRALMSSLAMHKGLPEPSGCRTLQQVRERLVNDIAPHLANMHSAADSTAVVEIEHLIAKETAMRVYNYNLVAAVTNFYQTDCWSHNSKVMADCTKMIMDNSHNYSRKQ